MSVSAIAEYVVLDGDSDLDRRSPATRLRPGGVLAGQAGTIREMLGILETLTTAGQRHSMNKIVDFLAKHVLAARCDLGRRNKEALMRLIGALRAESERFLPEPTLFSHQTKSILALMGSVA